jgi:hypothetical protein
MRCSYVLVLTVAVATLAMPARARPVGAAPTSTSAGAGSMARYKPTSVASLAHFEAGNRLYKSGLKRERPFADRVRDLRGAIDEYQAGAQLEDAPAFDYNMGHTAWLLLDNPSAVAHLLRFLDRARPDDHLRAAIEKEIASLDPSGAIRDDLRRAQPTASADAAESASTKATASVGPVLKAAQPVPTSRVDGAPLERTPPEPSRPSHAWTWVGWGLTGAGLAGGGLTTWLVVSANSLDRDAQATNRSSNERLDVQDRADARRRAALFTGIGSGVAVVLGLVTLAFPARSDGRRATSAWNLRLTGNGVAVVGRF